MEKNIEKHGVLPVPIRRNRCILRSLKPSVFKLIRRRRPTLVLTEIKGAVSVTPLFTFTSGDAINEIALWKIPTHPEEYLGWLQNGFWGEKTVDGLDGTWITNIAKDSQINVGWSFWAHYELGLDGYSIL